MSTCCIDGLTDIPVRRPASVAELGEIVREAGAAIYPVGGATMLDLGRPPTQPGQAIDTRALDQVIEFPARDMTVTVQAGITLARLQSMLHPENLRLPIDVSRAAEATLGGILATNTSGPLRYGFGTLRDYVIGIGAVNDEGREFKAGGRVVKNVAGYDLCKLLIGSLGTLGIITQATLKLRPRAEEQALVCLPVDEPNLARVLTQMHESRTRPVCVELLHRTAAAVVFGAAQMTAPDATWTVLAGYEGNAEAVNWQVQQLVKELGTTCKVEARLASTAAPLLPALVDCLLWPDAAVSLRATLVPSAVAAFCQKAATQEPRPWLRAHAGNGIVMGHWGADLTSAGASRILELWRSEAAAGKGGVVVTRCPAAWKATLDVWGPPRGDAWLMQEIKQKLDPRRVFNPGRFIDGI